MKLRPLLSIVIIAFCLFFSVGHPTWAQQSENLGQTIEKTSNGQWQISWLTEVGKKYTLQRSGDLQAWIAVTTITATDSAIVHVDQTAPAETQLFWRVVLEDGTTIPLFSIVELKKVAGGWQVTWDSREGSRYLLQHSPDMKAWLDVVTVTAGPGSSSAHIDTTVPAGAVEFFWRVIGLDGSGPDTTAPTVSVVQMQRADDGENPRIALSVVAQDNTAVTGVEFKDGDTLIGAATRSPGTDSWVLEIPFDPASGSTLQLSATATDAAGNTGDSPIVLLTPNNSSAPAGFAPIGGSGQPVAGGGLLGRSAGGGLAPLAYVPGGSTVNPDTAAFLSFPEGADVQPDGITNFDEAKLEFGKGSPLQVADPDGLSAAPGAALLDGGDVPFDQLRQIFGIPEGEGIDLLAYGCFPIKLVAGTITASGIKGYQFALSDLGIPLPLTSGEYSDATLKLDGEKIEIACYGKVELPDVGGHRATLFISKDVPLTLTLRADCTMALEGKAGILFDNGFYAAVGIKLDDPDYCFSLESGGFEFDLIDSFAELLPDDPEECVTGTSDAELDIAESCLRAYRDAYFNFGRAAIARRSLDPDNLDTSDLTTPPSPFDTGSSIAEALVADLFTDDVTNLPLDAIEDYLQGLGKSAEGSWLLEGSLGRCRELVLVRQFLEERDDGTLEHQQAIGKANEYLALAVEAIKKRATGADSVTSVDASTRNIDLMFELRELIAELGDEAIDLDSAMGVMASASLKAYVAPFNLQPDMPQLGPEDNVTVAKLGRFALRDHVVNMRKFQQLSDLLDPEAINLNRMAAQHLIYHAVQKTTSDALAAIAARNTTAVFYAHTDISELLEVGLMFSYGPDEFITPADRSMILEEISDFSPEYDPSTDHDRLAEDVAALNIGLARLPQEGASLWLPFATRLHARLDAIIPPILADPASYDRKLLVSTIKAAAGYKRLSRFYGELDATFAFADQGADDNLDALIPELVSKAVDESDFYILDEAVRFMLAEGEHMEDIGFHPERRNYYDAVGAVLLEIHTIVAEAWENTEQDLADNPDVYSADMFLPGDLEVQRVAGSICFNRLTGKWRGAFSGDLALPRFDGTLTIANASLSSAGEFDLNAHGQLSIPGDEPAVTMSVLENKPLHVHFAYPDDFSISASARFQLENGIFFEGKLDVNDPLYSVSLEAGGLEFELAETLAALIPGDAITAQDIQDDSLRDLWADYHKFVALCAESGFRPESAPPSSGAGGLPSFSGDVSASDTHCLLRAWSALIQAEKIENLPNYTGSLPVITRSTARLDRQANEIQDDFRTAFGIGENFEAAYLVTRLHEITLTYDQLANAVEKLSVAGALDDGSLYFDLINYASAVRAVIDDITPLIDGRPELSADARLAQQTTEILLGVDSVSTTLKPVHTVNPEIVEIYGRRASSYLQTRGFNPDTGAIDFEFIATLSPAEAVDDEVRYLELIADQNGLGSEITVSELYIRALIDQAILQLETTLEEEDLPLGQLREALETLVSIPSIQAQSNLDEFYRPDADFRNRLKQKAEKLLVQAGNLPDARWTTRLEYLEAIASIHQIHIYSEQPFEIDYPPLLAACARQMIADGRGRMTDAEESLLIFISTIPTPETVDIANLRLQRAAAAHHAISDRPWTADDIPLGAELAGEILRLRQLAQLFGTSFLPTQNQPAQLLIRLDSALIGICSAEIVATPLNQVVDLYRAFAPISNEPNDASFKTVLTGEIARLLEAARVIGTSYAPEIAALTDENRPSDFKLPESIAVRRVYGSLFFNRETGYLKGTFAGRLEFPAEEAFFEITEATIDTDGSFRIDAATETPLDPFGLENVTVSADIDIVGSTAGLDTLTGNAEVKIKNPENNTVQTFGGGVAYNSNLPGAPLTFTASLDGLENNERLRFTDQLVFFGGDLAVQFSTLDPLESASVTVGGRAGLFAKDDLVSPISKDQFYAFIDIAGVKLAWQEDTASIMFQGGSLTLDENQYASAADGGSVALPLPTFCASYNFADEKLSFSPNEGSDEPVILDVPAMQFSIPQLANFGVEVSTCKIQLPNRAADNTAWQAYFPILSELDAELKFDLPGNTTSSPDRNVVLGIAGKDWRLDGLPHLFEITLEEDLSLLDLGGFEFKLLGGINPVLLPSGAMGDCQTLLRFTDDEVDGTLFELYGGMRASFESDVLYDENTNREFAATLCGSFKWDFENPPEFGLEVAVIEGRFRLGGNNGIGVQGTTEQTLASISFSGLDNLFGQSSSTPFAITLNGALNIAEFATFGLEQTSFIFTGNGIQFQPGAFIFEAGEEAIDIVDGILPAYITAARLDFLENQNLSIEELLAPTNLKVTLSGEIHLPNKEAIDNGSPGISGQVDDLSVLLIDQGNGLYTPQINTNGFGMQVENLDIPPLGGLTGGLYIGNLNQPQNLYFAGIVGGEINGMGAEVLLAINTTGVLGACFDINAGPSGISLPYGFQITGATGGISLLNGFADPCDFSDYIRLQMQDGAMKPVNDDTVDSFAPTGIPEQPMSSDPWVHCLNGGASAGQFPLDSVNPLCEPHPNPNIDRVVYKGTVLDETGLALIGITPGTPALQGTIEEAVDYAALRFRAAVAGSGAEFLDLLTRPSAAGLDPSDPVFDYIQSLIDLALDGAEDMARSAVQNLLLDSVDCDGDGVIGNAPAGQSPSYYDVILELARCGVPCQDVTLKLKGKISHMAVSSFLHGDVGVTLSTTGSVGVEGAIVLMGIPVGEGQFVYQLTDTQGQINPSYGGIANIGIGPIELGSASFGYLCDDCYPAMITAFENLLANSFASAGPDATALMVRLMDQAVPLADGLKRDLNVPAATHFSLIATPEQKVAVISELFNLITLQNAHDELENIEQQVDLAAIYGDGVDGLIGELLGHFKTFLADLLQSVDMSMCFESTTQPKVFGFPLGSDVGSSLFFDTRAVYDGKIYHELRGDYSFSPSQMLSSVVTNGFGAYLPANDVATMAFSLRVDAFDAETAADAIDDPLGFAGAQAENFINDAVVTFDYQLQPFGLKLASGKARGIMPRFDEHPDRNGYSWNRPAGPDVASRSELILAAVNKGVLSDIAWRGQTGQLYELFLGDDPAGCAQGIEEIRNRINQAEMESLDFALDYFPYGGFIGGAELELPNFITELPPSNFSKLLIAPQTPEEISDWVSNAGDIFNNYLTASTCVGQMAMYIPAPSPGADFALENPEEMWGAIKSFDVAQMIDRTLPEFPISELMLEGWLEVPILGMPQMRGEMKWDEMDKRFKATLEIPPTSWISDVVPGATLEVIVDAPPYLQNDNSSIGLEELFLPVQNAVAGVDPNATELPPGLYDSFVAVMNDSLPKASVIADAQFDVPPHLQPFIQGSSALELYGFSFAHTPDHEPGSSDPFDIAMARGGLGLRGAFTLGYAPAGVSINVPNVGMSITPAAGNVFPALNGIAQITDVDPMPGIVPRFSNAEIAFSSSPNVGAPYVKISGDLEEFRFDVPETNNTRLLTFTSLSGGDLHADFAVVNGAGGTATEMTVDPARATMPFLGQDVAINAALTFSTVPGENWSANVSITNQDGNGPPVFNIRDPRQPAGDILMSIAPNGNATGMIAGNGLDAFNLELSVPCNGTVTFFPGKETATTVPLGLPGGDPCVFFIDHLGRFFFDLGADRSINLPGIVSASGHVVFGYNSTGSNPALQITPSGTNYGQVDIAESKTQEFTVTNIGLATAVVNVTTDRPEHFSVPNGTFTLDPALDPGESHAVAVVFHPQEIGNLPAVLTFSSNDPADPERTIALQGQGTGAPKYFQSRDEIAFGPTLVGGTSRGTITIGNSGSLPLDISSMSKTGSSAFTIKPAIGARTFAPGESTTYQVSFSPLLEQPYSGFLDITVDGEIESIELSGNGAESQWFTIRDAKIAGYDTHLNDIRMDSATRGHAVGDDGVVLQTTNGGHSWQRRDFTKYDMHAIAPARSVIEGRIVAEYHFDDGATELVFRDDSGNGYHGTTTLTNRPRAINYDPAVPGATGDHEQFGNGFLSTSNYIDLANFAMDAGDFKIAMWIKPTNLTGNHAYLGKNAANGADQFVFGYYNGSPRLSVNNSNWNLPITLTTAWQHFFFSVGSANNQTQVSVYRDGSFIANHTFPGTIELSGRPWSLGSEYDNSTRGDFARAGIDEVYFIEGSVPTNAIAALANGGPKMVVAGDGGMVFQTYTGGSSWGQVPDTAAYGWKGISGGFDPYHWRGAGFDSSGRLFLAGRVGTAGSTSALLSENSSGDLIERPSPLSGGVFTGAFHTSNRIYAIGDNGRVYRATSAAGTWGQHGSASLSGAALAGYQNSGASGYVVVGEGGETLRSASGGNPGLVTTVTNADLRGIDIEAGTFHAVGDGGIYLKSDNDGDNWTDTVDGLRGNNRGVSVGDDSVFVAGEDQRISLRPSAGVDQPFLVFDPGELDFGYLLAGETKTLPVRIYNRGRRDLAITNIAISGARYSIFQADVDRLAPGDWVTILVRYKPTTASERDLGTLTLGTPGGDFPIPLTGRQDSGRWQPKSVLGSNGNPFAGEVIDMDFTSEDRGYVVYRSPSNQTGVRYTTDGGETWNSSLILPFIDFAQRYEVSGIDMSGTGTNTDQGYVVGSIVEIATGNFVEGFVKRTTSGGRFFNIGADLPAPNDHRCTDVAIHDDANPNIAFVATAAKGGIAGNVWQTSTSGASWIQRTGQPNKFDPDRVAVAPNVNTPTISHVFTNWGTSLYFRPFGFNWPSTTEAITFPEQQSIRDFAFYDDPGGGPLAFDNGWIVGDSGLFWRLEPGAVLDWRPAEDAEVFGTTDLSGVAFHQNTRGWICGESRIFRSNNGGRSWGLSFDAGEASQMNSIKTPALNRAYAGGSLNGQATIWKYANSTSAARPILSVDDLVIFPELEPGESDTRTIAMQNAGNAPLEVTNASIVSDDPLSRYEILSTSNSAIELRFAAKTEPELVADLGPEVFLRFEQARTASEYYDDSIAKFHATPAAGDAAPHIEQEQLARDRCLRFDGGDHAEIDAEFDDIEDDFSISLWAIPDEASNGQFFIGKHSATGNTNIILFGLHNNGYYFGIRSNFHAAGDQRAGWQHLVATGKRNGSGTDVTIWRDGEILWQQNLPQLVGNAAGQAWILGADRDGGGVIDQHLKGGLDDVAIFNRVLTPGEIAALGNKSPLVGEHRARLVINSNAGGAREVDLRAQVAEPGEMIVFKSDPPNQTITIDGNEYTTPVAFSVKATATSEQEWTEGSMHRVVTDTNISVTNPEGDTVNYEFANSETGTAETQVVCASRDMGDQTTSYRLKDVDGAAAPPAPGSGANNPQTLIDALTDTPAGPFLRITDGEINLPSADDFTIEGSIFVSPSLIDGTLSTTPISFPPTGANKFIELGSSQWNFHLEAGEYHLRATPPSVKALGRDIAPDGQVSIDLDTNSYEIGMVLGDEFKPFPGYLEFREGANFNVAYAGGSHSMSLGGVYVLQKPDGNWVVENASLALATPASPINLRTALNLPDPLFASGPIEVDWGSGGNLLLTHGTGGFGLEFNNMNLSAFGDRLLTNADASVTSNGTAEFSGSANTLTLPQDFSLTPVAASPQIKFCISTGGTPSFQFRLPGMDLQHDELSTGIRLLPIDIDTGGDFDSGKIELPTLSVGGVGISPRPDGELKDNHVRFSRSDGQLLLHLRSEVDFRPPPLFLSCGWHQIDFKIGSGGVRGTMDGNFCTPIDFTLDFDSADPLYQFRGMDRDEIYEAGFGSGGAFFKLN